MLAALAALLSLAGPLFPAEAQSPLTLGEALERADRGGYANRARAGQVQAQAGAALAPYQGILPTVRLESGYYRTTDPLGAFGFTLRQRAVTPAAFAPARLNDPSATTNLATGVVIEQPLFNADAWLGRRAAAQAARSSRATEEWTRQETAVEVIRAYWGAVLARQQVGALREGWLAAQSHQRQAESLAREGLVTRSDALLAAVRAGEVETRLLQAESEARIARLGLALLMGQSGDTAFTLPDSLPAPVTLASATANAGAAGRADVMAADAARDAARADARRATALYLPRLNSFARLDWNSATEPFGGKSSWTIGLMLNWTPFAGAAEIAERRGAQGRQHSAEAMAEATTATAALQLARARDAAHVSEARVGITARGVSQAAEAHRIVGRKYAGGLASITELLDASALETAARLAGLAAGYDLIVARAEWRKAMGLELSALAEP
jgi:outer membrane protein TolC